MKKFNNYMRVLAALAVPAMVMTGCSDDDEPGGGSDGGGSEGSGGKYVLATTVEGSNGTTYVLVTAESLDEGSVTVVDNGLKNDGATQWVFHGTDYLYGLTYNQGNQGTTRSYVLGSNGAVKARDLEYNVSRFSSYGMYENYIISMATADGPVSQADANGYLPKTLTVTWLDVNAESKRENDTSTGVYSLENFVNNTGEYVTLAGVEPCGGRIFCGVVPMGLSQYGSAVDNGRYIRPECAHLVATADGGSGGGAYKRGELSGTQYPDECWVAIYENENMTNPILAHTDKISAPAGRFRSQYYQSVWATDDGDVYVFSPSYAKTMTDPVQQTSLAAGVCRIPAGSSQFDSYYCDLEAQSDGYSFMRCWYISGNYFLLQMYDQKLAPNLRSLSATHLAVFDAANKKLTYVSGLPSDVSSIGKTVYSRNGSVYIPVNSESGTPAIYRINPATAQAVKGLTVDATEVTGFGYMEPVK